MGVKSKELKECGGGPGRKDRRGGACWRLRVVPPEPPESTEGGRKKVELRVPGSPFLAPSSEKIHWC